MNNLCKTCEHYHYHEERLVDDVRTEWTAGEYVDWEQSIPCRSCKFNYTSDNYTEALKTCPFCGSEARIVVDEDDYLNKDYCVECGSCCADTRWFKTREEAIKAWNKRA